MSTAFHNYTTPDDRSLVNEGMFKEIASHEFKVGDYFLSPHVCIVTNARIMLRVDEIRLAYWFNGTPIYDLIVNGWGSYKYYEKHISRYDPLVKAMPIATEWLKASIRP
jgi:hypothetical protein